MTQNPSMNYSNKTKNTAKCWYDTRHGKLHETGETSFLPMDPGFTIPQGLISQKKPVPLVWNKVKKLHKKDKRKLSKSMILLSNSCEVLRCFKWYRETKDFFKEVRDWGLPLSCAKSSHNSWIQDRECQTCQLWALTQMNPQQRTQSSASHPLRIG